MSFWTSTLRKRRKEHSCATCGQVVAPGEHSFDESGVFDGDFNSYKQCQACHDIVAYFFWRGTFCPGQGFYLYELRDVARDEGLIWPPVWGYVDNAVEATA